MSKTQPKSFSSTYRLLIWPVVFIISYLGFWIPKLGIVLFPMFAAIMFIGFYRGRYWCGNICPRGSLWDKATLTKKFANKKFLPVFKSSTFRLFVLVGLMSLFTKNTVAAFHFWGESQFWDKLGMVGVIMCALTTTVGLTLALFVHPRAWCSFCPMGTVQKYLNKIKEATIEPLLPSPKLILAHPEACKKCNACAKVCPMQLIPYQQAGNSDCVQCGNCIIQCKKSVLEFQTAPSIVRPLKEWLVAKPTDENLEKLAN